MVSICWNLRYWIFGKLGTGLSDLWYRISGLGVLNRHIIHNILLDDGYLVYIKNNNKFIFENDLLLYLRGILTYQSLEKDN